MTDPTTQPLASDARRVMQNVERVIVGKADVVELMLVALLCEGHVLIEDVPGIGKTMLARSIARSLDCTFRRVQCTPDLLPADITGTYVYNQRTSDFEFRAGPIFTQVLLADEIKPRHAPQSIRSAGGHGGAAGHYRGRYSPSPTPLRGSGHPKPH